MARIKAIQRLFGECGNVLNTYEANDFKVDKATAEKAESLKPVLLNKVRYDRHYSLECGLFLHALVLATKIAKGEPLREEFDETCDRINTLLRMRDGVWQ